MAQDDYRTRITTAPGGIGTLQLGPQAYIDPRDQRYVHDAYQYFLNQQAAPQTAAPLVQDPTTMIPQTGGAGDQGLAVAPGITGASVVQPITNQAGAVAAMTQPAAYNVPGTMPKTPVSGAWGPQSYLQDQGPRVTLPSGDVFAADDPLLDEKTDYMGKPKSFWDNVKQRAAAGADIASEFGQSIADAFKSISPVYNLLNALEPASGRQQTLVRDQLVDSGVVLDDIGRIVQQPGIPYNDPRNVMAGYSPGPTGTIIPGTNIKIGGGTVQHSAAERINNIQDTLDNLDTQWSQLKKSDPEAFEAKKRALEDRQEALKEFINMGAAEAAGGVRLEDYDPGGVTTRTMHPTEGVIETTTRPQAGEVIYGTDYFPELGVEDKAPVTIEDVDEGFQTRFTAKDDGKWAGPGEISGVAGKTIVDPDTYMGSTVEGGLAKRGTIDRTQPTAPVTGVEGPPRILSPEVYQDQIMNIADERRALQQELEAYRDPIMDMEPAESVDLADIEGKDPRIVSEEQSLEGYPWLGYEDQIMGMAEESDKATVEQIADIADRQPEVIEQKKNELADIYDRQVDRGQREETPTVTSDINKAKAVIDMPQMLGDVGGGDRAPAPAPKSTPTPRAPDFVTGRGGGGDPGGGDKKIVCTMMNESYGFGSFRNKIWMKFHKDLSPEYQKGYHKLFLPLVKIAKTNKVVKKVLEHIAVHSTIDMRQATRGKKHLLGRVYRKILLPLCYIVGKYVKK